MKRNVTKWRERVNAEYGAMLTEKDAVRKRWTQYFERLPHGDKPVIVAVGWERGMNI